jgi:uncharacterized protein (TIGR03086 family)
VTGTVGPAPHDALELLERALAYTRVALCAVGPDRSGPTPCAGWSLADLLAHMDDGLDAFLEAAGGAVRLPLLVPPRPGADLEALQAKACHLLGLWSAPVPPVVAVGDRTVPSGLLVSAAALEITVHGWDVGRATGAARDLPEDLARALMPVAHAVVLPQDRPERFAPPVPSPSRTGAPGVLLAFLGRS